jgi:hypothetical protein
VNEEQRKQRDARVAELAEAAVDEVVWFRPTAVPEVLKAAFRARINLALDEQAKEIAAAIAPSEGSDWGGEDYYTECAEIAAGFGDDR